jgi:hypothetical protein
MCVAFKFIAVLFLYKTQAPKGLSQTCKRQQGNTTHKSYHCSLSPQRQHHHCSSKGGLALASWDASAALSAECARPSLRANCPTACAQQTQTQRWEDCCLHRCPSSTVGKWRSASAGSGCRTQTAASQQSPRSWQLLLRRLSGCSRKIGGRWFGQITAHATSNHRPASSTQLSAQQNNGQQHVRWQREKAAARDRFRSCNCD